MAVCLAGLKFLTRWLSFSWPFGALFFLEKMYILRSRRVMINRFIAVLLLLFCCFATMGNPADSLLQVYHKAGTFKQKLETGNKLIFLLRFDQKQLAKTIGRSLLADERIKQYPNDHACTWIRLGIVYDLTHLPDSAILCNEKALLLAKQNSNVSNQASALNNLGLIYWNYNQLDKATDHFTRALGFFEAGKDTLNQGHALNNLGLIMYELQAKQKAIGYHRRALRLFQQAGNKYGTGSALHNIAFSQTHPDSAKYYYYKTVVLQKEIEDHYGLAKTYNNLAILYAANRDSALHYYQLAIIHHQKADNLYGQASTMGTMANYLLENDGDLEQALELALKSREIAKKIGYIKYLWKSEGILGRIYLEKNDHKNAAAHLKAALYAKDSVMKEEVFTSSQQLEFKYNVAQKEKQLAEQKADIANKKRLIAQAESEKKTVWIILVIIAFIAVFLFYLYKRKQALEKQAALKLVLSEQMALNKIQQDRLRISRELHDNIGSYLTLINATMEQWPDTGKPLTENQINSMKNSLTMTMRELRKTVWLLNKSAVSIDEVVLKLRDFLRPVEYNGISILVTAKGDTRQELNEVGITHLFRIIQESVNNAVKHAGCSNIRIRLSAGEDRTVFFSVSDDGKGFDPSLPSTGNGLNNIRTRAQQLGATLDIEALPGEGTTIKGSFVIC